MIARVRLSQGLCRGGDRHFDAELRELAGADEGSLAKLPSRVPIAELVSELLALTVVRIGNVSPVTIAETRELSIGDRERLLLHLYAHNFARDLRLHTECAQCGEEIDGHVEIADLLIPPATAPHADYELGTEAGEIRFRLPQGADQEAAASLAQVDLDSACDLLVERCLVATDGEIDTKGMRNALEEKFAELDPQAETVVQLVCPLCGATTGILVDASALVFARLASGARLLDEVDSIARSYHWSEREILALPAARRRAYLQRIGDGVAVE